MLAASPIEEVEMNTTTTTGTLRIVAGLASWGPQAGFSSWGLRVGLSSWELPRAGAVAWDPQAVACA